MEITYIIEICVAIIIALLSIAYPIIVDKTSNIGEKYNSEYVENGFDYVDENGVLVNNAVYIQYYDTDYSIKQAQ